MKNTILKFYISPILVIMQFTCLAVLVITGPIFADNPLLFFTEIIGILNLIWSVSVMSLSKLSVFPEIRKGAIFISYGPYKYIRHPMYLAVILFSVSVVIDLLSLSRLLILIILIAVLINKIEFEEKLLLLNFKEYKEYRKTNKKLIPFIY